MNKVKTIAAMGALLMGASYAQPSDQGVYSVDVQEDTKLYLSDNSEAAKSDAKDILQGTGANTTDSKLALAFTVETNREKWDLSLETAHGGKLLRTSDDYPLKTDLVSDGSLGDGGSLLVSIIEVEDGDKTNPPNFAVGESHDINVNSTVSSLANEFSKTEFANDGEVKAVFEVRAGLAGNKVIAPPGTYTETVTLTFIGNTGGAASP